MAKSPLQKERGFILVIVIMSVIIMTAIVLGVLSRNVSQAIFLSESVKRTQAALLARSAMWRAVEILRNGGSLTNYTQTVDGILYTITYTVGGAGPQGASTFSVNVTY